jgi:hypothetical protein
MLMSRHLLPALVVSLAACASAQSPNVSPVTIEARLAAAKRAASEIRESDIRRDVDYLASDANMGRRTPFPNAPSPGYDSAATYVARLLKELGVKPMGDNGTYFAHYTVTQSRLDTTRVSGSIGTEPLTWGDDFYVFSFLVGGIRQADVVYVGDGLARRKKGIDPYAGLDIKGKWILVNPVTVRGQVRSGGVLGAPDTMGVIGIDYTTYLEEARFKGALGILLVPNAGLRNGWNRRATTGQDLNPSLGVAYAQYQVPRVVLSDAAVRRLLAGTTVPAAEVLAADSTKRYPKSAALGKRVTINFAATTSEARPYNVVGLWEGSDPALKDEWISLAAHLDGAVRAGGEKPDNTLPDQYNAADDNASGSAGNMAIARAIVAGPRPKRSILMIWDSGEEVGLWGTRHIAYGPWSNKLVLHVSNDMIGRSRPPNSAPIQNLSSSDSIYVTGPKLLSSATQANLLRAAKEFPFIALDQVYEDVTSEFYYPRTDAGPYLENGIPIMQFFNGTTPEYHQPTDEPRLLDITKIANVSKLSYGALWLAADDPKRPTWDGPVPYTLWWVTPKHR